ncbi:MAG: molybdenum cofactor guanylyltransferase [Mycobacteriales bacterium]
MDTAGVVLAGGRSSRMGSSKAALEWHGSTLLRRVTGILSRCVDGPVVVVRAPGQPLPALPPGIEVLDDPAEGRGPLQGIAVGLTALVDRAETAFVCSTDLPLLHPAFVRRVTRADGADVVLPVVAGHRQPLAACYRTCLAAAAVRLVAADRLRPACLYDDAVVTELVEEALLADPALRLADPDLDSVSGVNTPAAYRAARERPAPTVTVQRFGVLASGGDHEQRTVRAATLAGAAAAVGLTLSRHILAALNGDQMSRDPELPLASGDSVAFLSADAGG